MKRFKAGEIALLVVPVAAVAGFAWWQGRHTPRVQSVRVVPPTPYDVARGFDVNLEVKAQGATDLTPEEARQKMKLAETSASVTDAFWKSGGKSGRIALRSTGRVTDYAKNNGSTTVWALRLRDVPLGKGEIRVVGYVNQHWRRDEVIGGVRTGTIPRQKRAWFSKVVRRAGERVTSPAKVSRYRPFVLLATQVKPAMVNTSGPTPVRGAEVTLRFRATDNRSGPEMLNFKASADIVSASGRTHNDVLLPDGSSTAFGIYSIPVVQPDGTFSSVWQVPLGHIPKTAGRVTFRADISVDDCWPLPVSIVVRERNGTVPTTK